MTSLTIADLVAMTEVPSATIHYYLRQGLLPSPRRIAPNRFAYDGRHVHALKLVRSLRERRGLSLPMIRRIMPELLRLEGEDAFRPEIWDRALAPRLSRRRMPSARILDAAKEAFARRGYAEANVDDICRSARMAKGSFYRYYRSKEELFFAAAAALANDVAGGFERAAGPDGLAPAEAAPVLTRLIAPALPVFLELFAGALQGRSGHGAAARALAEPAAARIGRHVRAEGAPEERGAAAIAAALAAGLGRSGALGSAYGPGGTARA